MLHLLNLEYEVGEFRLREIEIEIPGGAYAILLGRTGSGKTSLLEIICGLRAIRSGEVWLDGQNVTGWPPAERGIGYVPQDGVLFAAMSVRRQIELSMEVRHWPRSRIRERVEELATLLDIGDLLKRRPVGLSGGERQRVALARALAFKPKLMCLDEPLSALDEETKEQMYRVLERTAAHEGTTFVHVTHYREEANRLGSLQFKLEEGRVIISG